MKQCPRCRQTYKDDNLNFCLDDGELLMAFAQGPPGGRLADDAPPTILLDQSRVTNPSNWPGAGPVGQWQPQNLQPMPFGSVMPRSRDQTLPTISLVLGILALLLTCCWGGIWLGVPAAIVGLLGMRNADKDSSRYGGRGLAIGGMVTGVISFLATLIYILIFIFNQ
jgi:hypothetical protein